MWTLGSVVFTADMFRLMWSLQLVAWLECFQTGSLVCGSPAFELLSSKICVAQQCTVTRQWVQSLSCVTTELDNILRTIKTLILRILRLGFNGHYTTTDFMMYTLQFPKVHSQIFKKLMKKLHLTLQGKKTIQVWGVKHEFRRPSLQKTIALYPSAAADASFAADQEGCWMCAFYTCISSL